MPTFEKIQTVGEHLTALETNQDHLYDSKHIVLHIWIKGKIYMHRKKNDRKYSKTLTDFCYLYFFL